MPLTPIDLQTMFVRLSELSRQQAALHDGAVQKAAVDMAESAQEAKDVEDRVQRTQEIPLGPEKIREENRQGQKEGGNSPHKKRKTDIKTAEEQEAAPPEPEVVRDPKLGSRIDISG